jgi:hypothetical protein
MKVAIIFATDGSACEDAVLAPFWSAGLVDGLRVGGIEPVVVSLLPDHAARGAETAVGDRLRCRRNELAALLVAKRPQAIQTFGSEHHLAAIWPIMAEAGVPIAHCVSCWRDAADAVPASSIPSFAVSRAKRASSHVAALIGTSRAAVGGLIAAGYFQNAMSSVMVPPPAERAVAVNARSGQPGEPARARVSEADPVFGIYDPCASPALVAFVSRAVELTGRRSALQVRIAAAASMPAAPAPITIVPADGIEDFLAAIDVLAVPAYDDGIAAALIAALRAGKSVIVPDPSGAAELIEYGRHGLLFCAGSAYHFANALDLVGQSWSQRPVLLADGGPAVARTHPAAVARVLAAVYGRLLSPDHRVMSRQPSHG